MDQASQRSSARPRNERYIIQRVFLRGLGLASAENLSYLTTTHAPKNLDFPGVSDLEVRPSASTKLFEQRSPCSHYPSSHGCGFRGHATCLQHCAQWLRSPVDRNNFERAPLITPVQIWNEAVHACVSKFIQVLKLMLNKILESTRGRRSLTCQTSGSSYRKSKVRQKIFHYFFLIQVPGPPSAMQWLALVTMIHL